MAGKYCRIEWRLMLEVDHVVPLWKVAGLPTAKRRQYFKIGNLQLRCGSCHKRKSAKEAADRAHHKRLGKPKRPARVKLKGRGFGPSRGFDMLPELEIESQAKAPELTAREDPAVGHDGAGRASRGAGTPAANADEDDLLGIPKLLQRTA